MSWSRQVTSPDEAVAALAAPGDALDLRVAAPPGASAAEDEAWRALGFRPLVPGELVRPVPVVLDGPERTRALGSRLAGALRPGDLVVLSGPLGAGKTVLTQGIGQGLGVHGQVTSPTFVLARAHRGPVPLVHVDAYRLREAGAGRVDLDDLDLDAELERGVAVVEWGEGLVEDLAESRLEVRLDRPAGAPEQLRTAVVVASGPRWRSVP